MNTRNSFEKKILEDFRNLPEEQRKKFIALIENLKAEVLQSNSNGKNREWSKLDEKFFKLLENRHFKVSPDIDIDLLMQDLNNGLS
jgi:hypothetical protein